MLAFTVTDVKSFHDMPLLVVHCDEERSKNQTELKKQTKHFLLGKSYQVNLYLDKW